MIRTLRVGMILLVIGQGMLALAAKAPLKAGVARIDITPPQGVEMWGFSARKSVSLGTIDPLFARVLVLAVGDSRLALVTLDLGRSFGPDSLARLRDMARKESNIALVIAAASHTHSGPVISDHYESNRAPDWETTALEKIARAIHEASEHLAEVRIGFGYGISYIGYNRLQTKLDGRPKFTNDTSQIVSSPVDPTVGVIRIDTQEGKPLAILVNYACHPVVFGADNVRYSADFPAATAHAVEAAFDNKPLCFFLQGAPGDIDPYYANTPFQEDPEKWRQWTGAQLGQEAARVAKNIPLRDEPEGSLDYAEDILTFQPRWDAEKFRAAFLSVWGPGHFEQYFPALAPELHLPVSTVMINKRIAFAILPGEPFVELQIDWRNRSPVKDTFFVGYSDGYFGYFPTIPAAARGGYGASSCMTWVEVGAGERMVNDAVTQTYRMLGKLEDGPQ
jgi:neutral ceramidase